ncbi:type II secretion system F family protein [Mycobacterium spongiae]|uniref:Type II secretion system protein GspF domain-containing protein n=1 Tax=Mycobacterium spongiae TaxID=886343 RepID=A0A975K3J4_9MYCO|nr:type II secretion system F family protein [Mycobacterium spongiae]QUR69218.1 hypothetical protein F6B93_20980 [Mycobacterium spongiae]
MTGPAPAALILAIAVLLVPSAPRHRLVRKDSGRGRVRLINSGWLGCIAGCVSAGVAIVVPPTTVVAAAVVGATASLRYRRRRRGQRSCRETRALEAGLESLVGELRAGAHPVRAFSVAADEASGPVSAAFGAVAARARLGADVAAGLRSIARDSALPGYWERLAVSWQLANDHGLAIATVMRAAQRDIAERQRFSARMASGMAGARASATVLAGLPVLGVLLGQLIGARPVSFLLSGSAGGWLLVAGITLACAGLLWSDRITDWPAS